MIKDQIAAVLVCDDVRAEANGKQIIIGVYPAYIVVTQMPFNLPLSFWIEFTPVRVGDQTIFIKVSYTTGFTATGKVDLKVSHLQTFGLGMPPVFVTGTADGELIIEMSFDSENWEEVKRKKIQKGPVGITHASFASPSGA